ncbi:hypothetical protein FHP88_15570 [Sedimenticola selenatireducens]|uniref:Uncharacterized protein n=1 Tax=Sedimenticola selenatireducens TaxID=191960 RepID=A0A557S0B7_9GAMM|nr:hypothetical protein [Sedimenticola selenatireducens]TVO70872.1 hypothetical protein FHP88_15570 [Sedimenticola selenatireducens]
MTYSDEYINFYGDLYLANWALLQARGVLFITFLSAPTDILEAAAFNWPLSDKQTLDYERLLPVQEELMERIFNDEADREDEVLASQLEEVTASGPHPVKRNAGRLYEPMEHNAFPAKRGRRCSFRKYQEVCG